MRELFWIFVVITMWLILAGWFIKPANASCSNMQRVAQASASHAAATGQYNHNWFNSYGRARGGLAENLAVARSREDAMRQWRGSPDHAVMLQLSGPRFACKSIASACSRRGFCYYAMAIGERD